MYLASLINKGREVYANGTTDPTALSAETILRMVTVNGAKSVLWDDELGSLEVGKKVGIGSDYLAIIYLKFVLILLTNKKILDS
jgi:hypothetical protein